MREFAKLTMVFSAFIFWVNTISHLFGYGNSLYDEKYIVLAFVFSVLALRVLLMYFVEMYVETVIANEK